MVKKLTNEYVRKQFELEDYTLLCDYVNSRTKLSYVCSKRHKHSILWGNWRRGIRCPYCSGKIKKTIEFIKSEFGKEKFVLKTFKYTNAYQKLDYSCPNGHFHSMSWISWQIGNRCPYCSGKIKKTIEFIKSEFGKEKYVLLATKYINSKHKLKYICPKGHENSMSWNNWQCGKRCPSCYSLNSGGENHYLYGKYGPLSPFWKGGISCEPYCFEWSSKEFKEHIKERDGNRCLNPDCFGNSDNLVVHHIDYNKKNCEQENLITLCISCNSRANKDREWCRAWYDTIIYRRYKTQHD